MARIRYLKPDFFIDEDLKNIPYEARLFYAGMWCYADKEGRLEDRPERLKVQIMPYDRIDPEKILQILSSNKSTGKPYIVRYSVNGSRFIQILKWKDHQKPHHTEKESLIPFCNGEITVAETLNTSNLLDEHSPSPLSLSSPFSLPLFLEIISDLNNILNTTYKESKKTMELIQARLNEGFTVDDFKVVHRKMLRAWGADQKMVKYLRPITLYSNKFESYLQQKETTTKLTPEGVKAYIVGQSWLEKEATKDAG